MNTKGNKRIGLGAIGAVWVAIVCVCMLLAQIPEMTVQAYIQAQGKVIADTAKIRTDADANSTVLASVKEGDSLTINNEKTGTDGAVWYQVFVDASTLGYIRSDLVEKGSTGSSSSATAKPETTQAPTQTATPEATATPDIMVTPDAGSSGTETPATGNTVIDENGVEAVQPVSATVITDSVRIRSDATTSSNIVTTAKKDIVLTISGRKSDSEGKVWYQSTFTLDGTEVIGFIRSDFVSLSGEVVAITNTPVEETPVEEPIVEEVKDYDTVQVEGIWYLNNNVTGGQYSIDELITESASNATSLAASEKKVSSQKTILIILAILLVVLALAVTILIFKIKDMLEEDSYQTREQAPRCRPTEGASRNSDRNGQARPATPRPATPRPATPRPARPLPRVGAEEPRTGQRVVRPNPDSQGKMPRQAPPADNTRQQTVHTGAVRQAVRPSQDAPVKRVIATPPPSKGSRPVGTGAGSKPENYKPKNFMSDGEDEFEFEFLNWDGDEEKQ